MNTWYLSNDEHIYLSLTENPWGPLKCVVDVVFKRQHARDLLLELAHHFCNSTFIFRKRKVIRQVDTHSIQQFNSVYQRDRTTMKRRRLFRQTREPTNSISYRFRFLSLISLFDFKLPQTFPDFLSTL